MNFRKLAFVRSASGKVLEVVVSIWDVQNSAWKSKSKIEYEFDENDFLLNKTTFISRNGDALWDRTRKEEYNYSFEDNLIESLVFYWDQYIGEWLDAEKIENLLTDCGNDKEVTTFVVKDQATNLYAPSELGMYFYRQIEIDTNLEQLTINNVKVFPNPVSNIVQFDLPEVNSESKLEIFNANGKRILSDKIRQKESIDLSQFQSGLYYYKIKNQDEILTGKLIKD